MKPPLPIVLLAVLSALSPGEMRAEALPFDREVVCRLSLDGKPRSLSIRQGDNVWLGYDLERAAVFKAWQAPEEKPGLLRKEFVTVSVGSSLFEDRSDARWELRRGETAVPLAVRYLGCSHRNEHVELRWELRHDSAVLTLHERVPLRRAAERVARELRVEGLGEGEALVPPPAAREAWRLDTGAAPVLTGGEWYRLILP